MCFSLSGTKLLTCSLFNSAHLRLLMLVYLINVPGRITLNALGITKHRLQVI